jgi:hypothetical protein
MLLQITPVFRVVQGQISFDFRFKGLTELRWHQVHLHIVIVFTSMQSMPITSKVHLISVHVEMYSIQLSVNVFVSNLLRVCDFL